MNIKDFLMATRFPFVTASLIPVLITAAWCAVSEKIYSGSAPGFSWILTLLLAAGVVLVHLAANTLNDYFDWEGSDRINENGSPFNGGSRKKIGSRVSRNQFLIIALIIIAILIAICAFIFISGRPLVLYFAIPGILLSVFYSMPPL
jgi:1,4-dihydroxy-2-naphthoate octaprenyltransferase